MHSKNTIKETKNKKTKKKKRKIKMMVGLVQSIYLLNVVGMSSKLFCATLCHVKQSKFPFKKTSCWKFLDVKLTHFAIAAPIENNCSTVEELGTGVFYFINRSTQIHPYIES